VTTIEDLTIAAEAEWLAAWTAGPTEGEGVPLRYGAAAPDLTLLDHTGTERRLGEFWADGPALVMFWRHFGCGCGVARAERLREELARYREADLLPVIVGQGEPERAAAYRREHRVPCPILCDPDHVAYRAYGLGQWAVARVLHGAPMEYLAHERDVGVEFQAARRAGGRPLVDDPWRAVAEFVVNRAGVVRLSYAYQYCTDFPDPAVLTTAARVA
jgi:peroxiredoxin